MGSSERTAISGGLPYSGAQHPVKLDQDYL